MCRTLRLGRVERRFVIPDSRGLETGNCKSRADRAGRRPTSPVEKISPEHPQFEDVADVGRLIGVYVNDQVGDEQPDRYLATKTIGEVL